MAKVDSFLEAEQIFLEFLPVLVVPDFTMITHVSKRTLLTYFTTLITLQAICACILPVGEVSELSLLL